LRDDGQGSLPEPDPRLRRAVEIDEAIRRVRPAHWRDNQAKENTIKRALLPLLDGDPVEVERVFRIIKAQPEY
jgi:type I restriction enzyme R subunit